MEQDPQHTFNMRTEEGDAPDSTQRDVYDDVLRLLKEDKIAREIERGSLADAKEFGDIASICYVACRWRSEVRDVEG